MNCKGRKRSEREKQRAAAAQQRDALLKAHPPTSFSGKYGGTSRTASQLPVVAQGSTDARTRHDARPPSRDTGFVTLPQSAHHTYTGDSVLGVAVMHKSCLQPVFSEEAARDSARMRRG